MKEVIERYEKVHGYTPSIGELYGQYTDGNLALTDEQEDELLTKLEERGLI